MKKTRKNYLVIVLVAFTLLLSQLACGVSTTQQLASAVPPTETTKQKMEFEQTQEQPVDELETSPNPTKTPEPTKVPNTPTPQPEPINITAQGFGQDKQQLGYSFIIENPNSGFAFENSKFQIAAYDNAGTVVETDTGYIELVLPSQKIGIGGTLYLDEGVTVATIEIQLNAGDIEASDLTTTFTTDKVTYQASDYFPKALGIIINPYDRDIENLKVSAVAYNEAGEIIGGGLTYINFILAKNTTGANVSITSTGEVAKVELYPTISSLSLLVTDEDLPNDAQNLSFVKQGFGQSKSQTGYGMLIENPNSNFAIESTMFHITLYNEDGSVISVEEGYIDTLLPKQLLGVGGQIYHDKELNVAAADFQIKPGSFEQSDEIPTFTAENISFKADSYFPKVTGEILSPYNKDITYLRVSAIAYNEAGEIIGGGFTYLDFVPANGKIAVEVSVTVAGVPATVELYAAVSGLSEFE